MSQTMIAEAHAQSVAATLRRHEDGLLAYVARIVGTVEQARDIVQEAALRLLQEDPQRVDGKQIEWLYTVCRNRALDVRKREQRLSPLDDLPRVDVAPGPADRAEQREQQAQVLALLAELPARQQELLRLKFREGLSYKDIAGRTGLSESNVGLLLHTAIKALRGRLRVQS